MAASFRTLIPPSTLTSVTALLASLGENSVFLSICVVSYDLQSFQLTLSLLLQIDRLICTQLLNSIFLIVEKYLVCDVLRRSACFSSRVVPTQLLLNVAPYRLFRTYDKKLLEG